MRRVESYIAGLLRPSRGATTAASLACLLIMSAPAAANDVTGLWYDDSGRGAVMISKCGNSLCGHIQWLKEPLSSAGRPLVDAYNPDESKRRRRICGLQVLGNLRLQPDGSWDEGWIYDPKVGRSYNVDVSLLSPDELQIWGYLGIKMLGRKLVWRRAEAELPKCDAS